MLFRFITAFVFFGACSGRHFDNPVIDNGDYPDPGVIKVDGVYYAATTTNNNASEKYPIHTSTDLQNWKFIGYIFTASNFPVWSKPQYEFFAPEFHRVGDGYNVYFTARDSVNDVLALGIATSKNVTGPYTPQDRPILSIPGIFTLDSTLMNLNGSLMLAWVESQFIRVRNLTNDGLAWKDNVVVPLFQPELPWEGGTDEGPFYIYRNGYHYMFYSAGGFCDDTYKLGVARSRSPAGPYEKISAPLLVSDDRFKGPGHGSIVRDVDDEGWVFVHHAWKTGFVCGNNYRLMFCTSMEWGDDDWPKKMTIGD